MLKYYTIMTIYDLLPNRLLVGSWKLLIVVHLIVYIHMQLQLGKKYK